jgi:hypothetical protein
VVFSEARDAVVAIHNLATLSRSPKIARPRLAEILPEIVGSCNALRGAFGAHESCAELRAFAYSALDDLESVLGAAQAGPFDARARITLEQSATRAAADLDAATELLALALRAARPNPTEQSLNALARASLRATLPGHRGAARVKLDPCSEDLGVLADARIVGRLLVHLAAHVRSESGAALAVRARARRELAELVVELATPEDASLEELLVATPRRVPPSDVVVEAAAAAVGVTLRTDRARGELCLPRA